MYHFTFIDHGFWVGAKGSGGSFTWVNHQPCCGGYWNPGEPNGDGNDCVHVWDSQPDKGLNDVPCDDPIGYICEGHIYNFMSSVFRIFHVQL
jgi:hypothetical protein